ncbi:hypothetical protein GUJ93_ZPchr0011g28561 [Zizania palustris]|uniref:Uncharacterized protein n=1 Tax=Zizania palustris TaxID=103762 RepID=A0A8J5WHX7_ZIZPA|nr:hypothetical protein GUJ93_ZPchr0011g28561 [Zizania palustris]
MDQATRAIPGAGAAEAPKRRESAVAEPSRRLNPSRLRRADRTPPPPPPPPQPNRDHGARTSARKMVAGALREVVRKRIEEIGENGSTNGEDDGKDMVEELLGAEGGSFSEEEIVDFCYGHH